MNGEQKAGLKRAVRVALAGSISLLAGILGKAWGLVIPEWVLGLIVAGLTALLAGLGRWLRGKFPGKLNWLPI